MSTPRGRGSSGYLTPPPQSEAQYYYNAYNNSSGGMTSPPPPVENGVPFGRFGLTSYAFARIAPSGPPGAADVLSAAMGLQPGSIQQPQYNSRYHHNSNGVGNGAQYMPPPSEQDGTDTTADVIDNFDDLQQPPSLPGTMNERDELRKEDYILPGPGETENGEPSEREESPTPTSTVTPLQPFTPDTTLPSAPALSNPPSPTLSSKGNKGKPKTAKPTERAEPTLRKRKGNDEAVEQSTEEPGAEKENGKVDQPVVAAANGGDQSAVKSKSFWSFGNPITWFLVALHFSGVYYHSFGYFCARNATRLSLKILVRHPWFLPSWLGLSNEPIYYSYIKKERRSAIWYVWFVHFLKNLFRLVLVFWFVNRLLSAPSRLVNNKLRSKEIDTFIMNEPLEPTYMADFISDYSDTAPLSAADIELKRNKQHGIEDAQTEEERRALERYNTVSLDGDDYPDEAQFKTMGVHIRMILQNPSSRLSDLDKVIYGNQLSMWDFVNPGNIFSFLSQKGTDTASELGSGMKYLLPERMEPLLPSPNLLCDFMGQYRRTTQNIVLKKGCHDMNKFFLDYTYNKLAICAQAKDPYLMVQAEKRGTEHVNQLKKFMSDCDDALKKHKRNEQRRLGDAEMTCACSADYGAAELWAYASIEGRESMYIVDYSVVTRPYVETEDVNPLDILATFSLQSDPNTKVPIEKTDVAFWDQMGYSSSMKQPRDFVRFKAKVLPSEMSKIDFFGFNYGSSLSAWLSGLTAVSLDQKNATSSHVHGVLFSTINYIGTQMNLGDLDVVASTEITAKIIDERNKVAGIKRRQKREILNNLHNSLKAGGLITDTTNANGEGEGGKSQWGLPSFGDVVKRFVPDHQTQVEVDQDRLLNLNYPTLQQIEMDVNVPLSTCALRCLKKYDLLNMKRQIHYDNDILNLPRGSKRYAPPEYIFAEIPHHQQRK